MPRRTPRTGDDLDCEYVITVSDLHVGSTVAIAPHDALSTSDGHRLRLTLLQEWLLQAWRTVWRRAAQLTAGRYALVVNGDAIDGVHHRTTQLWTRDIALQLRAAIDLLQPHAARAEAVYVVEGTECHDLDTPSPLAEALGAVSAETDRVAGHRRLRLTVRGRRADWIHHVGSTSREYLKPNAVWVAASNHQLSCAKYGEPVPVAVTYSHRHSYVQARDTALVACATPPWQTRSRYGYRVAPSGPEEVGVVVHRFRREEPIPDVTAVTVRMS
jgi:hypothetical protein